jgi:hypothetical protein
MVGEVNKSLNAINTSLKDIAQRIKPDQDKKGGVDKSPQPIPQESGLERGKERTTPSLSAERAQLAAMVGEWKSSTEPKTMAMLDEWKSAPSEQTRGNTAATSLKEKQRSGAPATAGGRRVARDDTRRKNPPAEEKSVFFRPEQSK